MQTYWDGATNRWVTRQADGTIRAATNAEATLAYSNGAQAPVGSHGPAPAPAPVVNPNPTLHGGTGGQAPVPAQPAAPVVPGQGPGHWEQHGGGVPPVWVPDQRQGGVAPPTTPTPPAPAPPDWRTQQSWWGTLFPTGVLQRTAYDLDPNFAWNTLVNHNVANSASPEYQWLQQQQSRDYALYGDENTRLSATDDPAKNMTFADWIEQHAPGFHNEFQLQNASVKGYSNPFMQAGRFTG